MKEKKQERIRFFFIANLRLTTPYMSDDMKRMTLEMLRFMATY